MAKKKGEHYKLLKQMERKSTWLPIDNKTPYVEHASRAQ
jgi:hypothetical protein